MLATIGHRCDEIGHSARQLFSQYKILSKAVMLWPFLPVPVKLQLFCFLWLNSNLVKLNPGAGADGEENSSVDSDCIVVSGKNVMTKQ